MEVGGFRDLVSALDCLRHRVRTGSLSMEEFKQAAEDLLVQANASLDPKVAKIFVPAVQGDLKELGPLPRREFQRPLEALPQACLRA